MCMVVRASLNHTRVSAAGHYPATALHCPELHRKTLKGCVRLHGPASVLDVEDVEVGGRVFRCDVRCDVVHGPRGTAAWTTPPPRLLGCTAGSERLPGRWRTSTWQVRAHCVHWS